MTTRQRQLARPWGSVCCLLAALCLSPIAALAETFGGAIEDGKAYGAAVNSDMPNASTLPPESVPGYQTSAPPEADYYGNPSAIGDAANQAAAENPAAQAVTEGFVSRPMFTIDQSTDPMFQRMGQVEANAASIAGAMQGEYSSCQPVVLETPYPPTREACYENRLTENQTCSRKLVVACDPETDGCDAGGIVPGSWAGDMKVALMPGSNGDFILQFGTIADNYWGGYGAVYDRTLNFEITDANLINKFILTRAAFDDWLLIKINDTTVYVGPYGGDRLEVVTSEGGWFQIKQVRYCATCYGSPELGTSWNFALNVDLKPFLREGPNTIFMRTVVAGGGEGAIQITTRQKCPRNCHDTWDDSQCSTLQARSQ
ncbi:hypothetical protein [Sulfurivermis fontis]|uniref:hypothetical protein n=1 Tax=Sulfurivermis fontis TaxID=1972068 RepID=UPI000FDBBBD0|nr:hypothetical protein [Sulfurivermis fontis]